jgi:Glyoxalase/Bleomycin resistance protein/Dioxygenase superfamily
MSEPQARPIHHIGYWVDDLEEAAWRAHRDLGIGPFALASHISFARFEMAGRSADEPVVFDHSAAFAAWGPIVVELGQVHDIDDELAAAYGVRSGAVSHVSWLAPDLPAERARLAESGCTFINSAETGPVSVEWLTGGRLFDHPIEVHRDSAFMRGMHERLVQRTAEWDGGGIFVPMG